MDKVKVKKFNKKLLLIFIAMLAILGTLLTINAQANHVSPELESKVQRARAGECYLTYQDLADYYDILCCQHGTPLKGEGSASVHLTGTFNGTAFSYDFGKLLYNDDGSPTGYGIGSKIEEHTIYSQTNPFDKSSYTHYTLGWYKIVETRVGTPKESYIIAEMKKESDINDCGSYDLITGEDGNPIEYTGGFINAFSERLETGEYAYTVNQKYVLKADDGTCYRVSAGVDADGNVYYFYDTDAHGNVVIYSGKLTYTDPKRGIEIDYGGIHVDGMLYIFEGTISSGSTVAVNEGTLYLVDYDRVVELNGRYYYADITYDYNYIQVAWWSTDMGTSHGTIAPAAPNSLTKEAEAFEDYQLEITGQSELNYQHDPAPYSYQEYTITEGEDAGATGWITAPTIEYKPSFNDLKSVTERGDVPVYGHVMPSADADQNGVVNEADEVTVAFDYHTQEYVVGPFSVNYVKRVTKIDGRNRVEFSSITGTKLVTNLGELEFGTDWKFEFLADQGRDDSEDYAYPNPNEVFNLRIAYKPDLTEISEFGFDFRYMNAGSYLDIYDGVYNTVTWTYKYEDEFDDDDEFESRDVWLELTSIVPHDSQTLAHAIIGVRWYEYTSIKKEFKIEKAKILIEKETVDLDGNRVPIDKEYFFDIYINDEIFDTVSVKTKNGYGKGYSNVIYWLADDSDPTYEVVELGDNDVTMENETGTLTDGAKVKVKAKNTIAPKEGDLEITKSLVNPTPALEGETFHFVVEVTGTFSYNNGPFTTYNSANPLIIDATIVGAGTWRSGTFKWYGSAPHYKVYEVIPDGSDYELLNGSFTKQDGDLKYYKLSDGGDGYFRDGKTRSALATNTPTNEFSYLEVDKRMVSQEKPQPGEVFYAKAHIEGTFSYGGGAMATQSIDIDITLDEAHNWHWTSEKITWRKGDAPKYEVHEDLDRMPEGCSFAYISDANNTVERNKIEGTFKEERTLIIIVNKKDDDNKGKIKVRKLCETSDIYGLTFTFDVTVKGEFKYNNVEYGVGKPAGDTWNGQLTITPDGTVANSFAETGIFTWKKDATAPTYVVEEINIPSGSKFVSIQNEKKTVTSRHSIEGSLIPQTVDDSVGTVIINCTNTGVENKHAHLVIVKDSIDEAINGWTFYFDVEIKGNFTYTREDGTSTDYTIDNPLRLHGLADDVQAICGVEDWISGLITWKENEAAPTYSVTELATPAGSKFVSIANRNGVANGTTVTGTILEGTEYNYVTAINEPDGTTLDASLMVFKSAVTEDISGLPFYFDIEFKGKFEYGGVKYGPGEEAGDTFKLEKVEILADGAPFISGKVVWNEGDDAPTYRVTERDEYPTVDKYGNPVTVEFVSISTDENGVGITPGSKTIEGHLNLDKQIKVTAENKGNEPNGGHIMISKDVKDSSLTNLPFYFDVEIKGVFKYHDPEDVTIVRQYDNTTDPNNTLKFEKVVAYADGTDWISGYLEWEEGAAKPTYTITEKTAYFPDNVTTVSIRNIYEKIEKTLDKNSGEDLTITGTVNGGTTHIIAVNDIDRPEYEHGVLHVEKNALSEIIKGEHFFFNVTIEGDFWYGNDINTAKHYNKLEMTGDNAIEIAASYDGEGGTTWDSETIWWKKDAQEPTYTVEEDTSKFRNDAIQFVDIRNSSQTNTEPAISGNIDKDGNTWVIAENRYYGINKGKIEIYKKLYDATGKNEVKGVEFEFDITITYYNPDGSVKETTTETVPVVSGGYYRSGWKVWEKGTPAPTYHIEEVPQEGYTCEIDKPDGKLKYIDSEATEETDEYSRTGIVKVTAINYMQKQHSAKIKVVKELEINDKLNESDVKVSFTANVKVSGDFVYKDVPYKKDENILTIKVVLNKDNDYTWTMADEIYWVGDEAPIFVVEEPEEFIPSSWHLKSIITSPEDHELVDGGIGEATITNIWDYEESLELVMSLGGKVWDDTNRTLDKHVDAVENGMIDEDEPGVANVKVTIYRALVNKSNGQVVGLLDGVYAYDDAALATRIDPVTYTDETGNWSFKYISVPAFVSEEEKNAYDGYGVTYIAEFEYDGQTYEPTDFLVTGNGNYLSYVNAATDERSAYFNDSMAIDKGDERTAFNNTFAEIKGLSPMDSDGNTVGTTNSGKELNYTSVDSLYMFNSDNTRKISTLETLNADGTIKDDMKITASTATSNLAFPFYHTDPSADYSAWHLMSWDKIITDHLNIVYKYEAVYNYCLSINLGLVEREAADLAVEKDLTEALVVVNGKALKYKFNAAIDLDNPNNFELLYKQISVADAQIEYKLGLYKGDYYYRASVYNTDTTVRDKLAGFYSAKLGTSNLDITEMEIYLKYTIIVHNESETYDVSLNSLVDYYDNSFSLITDTEKRYVQTINGKEVNDVVEVAKPSTVTYYTAGLVEQETANVSWSSSSAPLGSDGIQYNKLTTDATRGRKLASGEVAKILVTFKVNKDTMDGVTNAIKLGQKHNVAEVANFSAYYSATSENRWSTPGEIAGRVDEDSAPDNVNIAEYNDKTYYEDDTDSAPIITIALNSEERALTGAAWDDAQTEDVGYGQKVGNGIFNPEEGDKVIEGLTTEIYESILIPVAGQDDLYEEYYFAWPTEDTGIEGLGGKTIAELTGGFHQSTTTDNFGEYYFIGMPAGNYKVRFVYGDKDIANGRKENQHELYYTGQDYKTTAYQYGFNNDSNGDGYIDNAWQDLTNSKLADIRVNDARDDEARRLVITAKSELLTYANTSVLATADSTAADRTELRGNYASVRETDPIHGDGYYMFAETAKINLHLEDINKISEVKNKVENYDDGRIGSILGDIKQAGKATGTESFLYVAKNIDCGIEERSQTKLTLDKQIKEIVLSTSDGDAILDAVYDIKYELGTDGSIKSTVSLNKDASKNFNMIASLNRSNSNQGYRYIMAEGRVLQGTQISVKYQLSVFNMSETDRCAKALSEMWDTYNGKTTDAERISVLDEAINKVTNKFYSQANGRKYNSGSSYEIAPYGVFVGSVYYLGSQGVGLRPDEMIVKTTIHNLIDYVDPDIEFLSENNNATNNTWSTANVDELFAQELLSPDVKAIRDDGSATIYTDDLKEYSTAQKNNVILSMDDKTANPDLVKALEPYMANKNVDRSTATIVLNTSRLFSSETDANDLDNIAEIIKLENTVGRRDIRTIVGNAKPENGPYAESLKEPDTSATELITLTPPTGLSPEESRKAQLLVVIVISISLIAVAIVIIKKKVLIKK